MNEEESNLDAMALDMILLKRHCEEYALACHAYIEKRQESETRLRIALDNLIKETASFAQKYLEYPEW